MSGNYREAKRDKEWFDERMNRNNRRQQGGGFVPVPSEHTRGSPPLLPPPVPKQTFNSFETWSPSGFYPPGYGSYEMSSGGPPMPGPPARWAQMTPLSMPPRPPGPMLTPQFNPGHVSRRPLGQPRSDQARPVGSSLWKPMCEIPYATGDMGKPPERIKYMSRGKFFKRMGELFEPLKDDIRNIVVESLKLRCTPMVAFGMFPVRMIGNEVVVKRKLGKPYAPIFLIILPDYFGPKDLEKFRNALQNTVWQHQWYRQVGFVFRKSFQLLDIEHWISPRCLYKSMQREGKKRKKWGGFVRIPAAEGQITEKKEMEGEMEDNSEDDSDESTIMDDQLVLVRRTN
ncbi:hypothetical protein F5B20DRAFT_535236 [Whalleya microplaca]|nr:hypothetical protein F5B20DRAFT_535236 [Whalleya microplaca]